MASRSKRTRTTATAPVKKPSPKALVRHVVVEHGPQRWWCGVHRRDDGMDHQLLVVQAPRFFDAQELLVVALGATTSREVTRDSVYVFPVSAKIAQKLPRG